MQRSTIDSLRAENAQLRSELATKATAQLLADNNCLTVSISVDRLT